AGQRSRRRFRPAGQRQRPHAGLAKGPGPAAARPRGGPRSGARRPPEGCRVAGCDRLRDVREEGLGGWSALRGYHFKEFRGRRSVLGTLEYRFDWISVLV